MPRSDRENYVRNRASAEQADARQARIRALNDGLRTTFIGGRVMITAALSALGAAVIAEVTAAVRDFTAFNGDNDPHDEHDFGAVTVGGISIFWKLDCYDKQLEYGSPDASDPEVTARVLTIMLASDY